MKPLRQQMVFTIYVCPVPDCGNVMTMGRAADHPLPPEREMWCYGSDAPGYPGSHTPTAATRVEVAESGGLLSRQTGAGSKP